MDFIIYAYDEERDEYWRVNLTRRQYRRVDNGAMISCGLTIPHDTKGKMSRATFDRLPKQAVTREQWQHAGCQSSCVLRGGQTCRW